MFELPEPSDECAGFAGIFGTEMGIAHLHGLGRMAGKPLDLLDGGSIAERQGDGCVPERVIPLDARPSDLPIQPFDLAMGLDADVLKMLLDIQSCLGFIHAGIARADKALTLLRRHTGQKLSQFGRDDL